MAPSVLSLHDETRGRSLPTTVYVPGSGPSSPLIVFGHGIWGHRPKFARLLARWAAPATSSRRPPSTHERREPGRRTLLLVHGTDDTGYAEVLELFEAAQEPKELVTIEGAEHDICQDDGQPHATRVTELTTAYWDRHLRSSLRGAACGAAD